MSPFQSIRIRLIFCSASLKAKAVKSDERLERALRELRRTNNQAIAAKEAGVLAGAVPTLGLAELARRIGADPSNLRKAINGEREFGLALERALRRYGGADDLRILFDSPPASCYKRTK